MSKESSQSYSVPLFVYGTLKRGCKLHAWLKGSEFSGEAIMLKAALINLGDYPALLNIPDENFSVAGELYYVPEKVFKRLEAMEHRVGYKTGQGLVKVKDTPFMANYFYLDTLIPGTTEWTEQFSTSGEVLPYYSE